MMKVRNLGRSEVRALSSKSIKGAKIMTNYHAFSGWCAVLPSVLLAMAVAAPLAMAQQHQAPTVKSLRLYVFDCGSLKIDPARFRVKLEDLATTKMSVPCFLVAHPKGDSDVGCRRGSGQ